MTSQNNFGVLPRREGISSPHNLRSCLRKGRISAKESDPSMHSSLASTASRTTNTPLSSQLNCEPVAEHSPVRASAEPMLARPSTHSTTYKHNNHEHRERYFMKISHCLVTECNKGYCNNPIDAKRLLHHYLPSYHEREEYYSTLCENLSVLPMFPEPGEHMSFSMTRCVQRFFGPILMNEINGSSRDMTHPAALEKSNQQVSYHPREYAAQPVESQRTTTTTFPIMKQSPPLDLNNDAIFPAPTSHEVNHSHRQTFAHTSENACSSTLRASNEHLKPENSAMKPSSPTSNTASETVPPASPPSLLSAARRNNFNMVPTPTSTSLLQKSTHVQLRDSPPPQPLPFFTKSPTQPQKIDLRSPSHELVAQLSTRDEKNFTKQHAQNKNNLSIETDNYDDADCMHNHQNAFRDTPKSTSSKFSQYQRLNSKEMLPPIIPREDVLYYPLPSIPPSSPCCFSSTPTPTRRQRRPASFLQLYVKCEWSEPFVQPDANMDIITWYKNKDNHVTADRTLVVNGTTSLLEMIRSVLLSFGLLDSKFDSSNVDSGESQDLISSMGCHNGVCFLSDVKATTCAETLETKLTPLPIPGFYYKYVARGSRGTTVADDAYPDKNGSTALSADPVGLQRTLTAQVLDTPLFSGSKQKRERPSQGRTRLALVYCTPKRQAHLSSRTQRAVLPETIYHFQIVLEGIVDEEDLPSSFQTQVPTRCVSGIGGVQGGNMIDSPEEVNELNRKLWGDRDVVGLLSPSSNREKNRERIIDDLSTPLFDPVGNQSLKEGVVQRCIYQISSGKLSMRIAERTQGTVDACNGTTDWLARQMDGINKSVSKRANTCMDEDLFCLGTEYDQKLEALVTKVML